MNRRRLLSACAVLPLLGLTACPASTPGATVPAQVVNDAALAINGLTGALNALGQVAPNVIPPDVKAKITSYLASASVVLGGLSTSLTSTQAVPIISQIEGAINSVISAAASIPLVPEPFRTALAAAAIVLPMLEAFVAGITQAPALAATPARAKALAAYPAMTLSDAETALKKLAGG